MIALGLLIIIGFIIVVIGLAKAFSASVRVRDLEQEVRSLTKRLSLLEQGMTPRAPAPAERPAPSPAPSAPSPVVPVLQPQADPHRVPGGPAGLFDKPATPSRTREEWESFIGGKLLNRIGALALILGIGFFLKYAFDNDWISETVRVLVGVAAGGICLAGAWRTHRGGLQIFAQGLVGAGLAILYLSVYASFNYYHLVPQWLAFAFMSAVTVLAIGQAFFYDSIATALLGLAGGFVTPWLLSTGSANEVGLFSYLALLDIGLFGTVMRKPSWQVIEPLALIGTWSYFAAWHGTYYHPDVFGVTLFFVAVFWFLHFIADVIRLGVMQDDPTEIQHATFVANSVAVLSVLILLLDHDHHAWMGTATIIFAVPYAAAIILFRRRGVTDPVIESRNALIATALLVIATAFEFTGLAVVRWWTLEAAVFMLIGLTRRMPAVRRAAPAILALAALKFLVTDQALAAGLIGPFTPVFNDRFVTLFLLAVISAGSALLLRGSSEQSAGAERRWLIPTLESAAAVCVAILVTVEINDVFVHHAHTLTLPDEQFMLFVRTLTLGVIWMGLAALMFELSRRIGTEQVSIVGAILAAAAVLASVGEGISFEPLSRFVPGWNLRAALMISAAVLGGLAAARLRQNADHWAWCGRVLPVLGIGIVAVILALLTGETRDYYEFLLSAPDLSREAIERLNSLQQLALSGTWLLFSLLLIGIGIWRGLRIHRLVAIALFGFTILKIFIYDLSFLQTLYRIFSFVGLGIILLSVSYIYQRYKYLILPESTPTGD